MNPNSSCKTLKRPKPVLNRKVNRLKTENTNKTGVYCNNESDKTKIISASNNESLGQLSPLVPKKSSLFGKNTQSCHSATITSATATDSTITTTVNTCDNDKSNPKIVNHNLLNSSSLNANTEWSTTKDELGVLNNRSPVPVLIDKEKLKVKNSKIIKKIDVRNKSYRKTKQFKTDTTSEIINDVHGRKSNARGKSSLIQDRLCPELVEFEQKSDNLPRKNSDYQKGVIVTSNKKINSGKNILTSTAVSNSKSNVNYTRKLKPKQNASNTTSLKNVNNKQMNESNTRTKSESGKNGDCTLTQFDKKKIALSESSQKSVSPDRTTNCKEKSYSQKNKPNLKQLRLNAYDDDGNLNKKHMAMRDFIYFNPPNNPMTKSIDQSAEESDYSSYIEDDETDPITAAPQVKVASDGKIIIDSESLIINPSGISKKMADLKKRKLIKEDDLTNRMKKKKRRKRKEGTMSSLLGLEEKQSVRQIWTPEETLMFYKVLNEFGSDFTTMMDAFPSRTRKQLKSKFLAEEKKRFKYVDLAMFEPNSIDFDALEKEIKESQVRKTKKNEDNERIIELENESKLRVEMEYARFKKLKKSRRNVNCLGDFDAGVRRVGKFYDEKVKRMKMYVRRLKSKYMEETGKSSKTCNNLSRSNRKKNVDSESDDLDSDSDEVYLFDLSNPLYDKMFRPNHEELFIQEIKTADDFDLFISLISEMYRRLGKSWCDWAKRKVVHQLLTIEEDNSAKVAAAKMKTVMDEEAKMEKLEQSYQLFSDPYDYVEPLSSCKYDC